MPGVVPASRRRGSRVPAAQAAPLVVPGDSAGASPSNSAAPAPSQAVGAAASKATAASSSKATTAPSSTPGHHSSERGAPIGIPAAVARRFLVLRHLLAPPRALPADATSVMRVVERRGSIQFDPLEVAGRNHDLVLLARIAGYRREWTDDLLYRQRLLFEAYNKGLSLLPVSELPWYRVTWDRARARHEGAAFDEHAPLVAELLERIRADGPLSSTDVEPRAAIDWYWRPTNQVRAILEALGEAGILGLARREGNRRIYDLAERLFPPNLLAERRPEREQRLHKLLSRYRAHGLLPRNGGSAELWLGTVAANTPEAPSRSARASLLAELLDHDVLTPIEIEGVRGTRLALTAELPILRQAEEEVRAGLPPGSAAPGVAFLAPLDPFVWDREFLRQLWSFDYIWEVYVPAAKRRWGYYVLPILFGDRLVGRIEPRIDRRAGTLRIIDAWWEAGFDPAEPGFADAFAEAVVAHALFGGAGRVSLPRAARHAAFMREVRDRIRSRLSGLSGSSGRRRASRETTNVRNTGRAAATRRRGASRTAA